MAKEKPTKKRRPKKDTTQQKVVRFLRQHGTLFAFLTSFFLSLSALILAWFSLSVHSDLRNLQADYYKALESQYEETYNLAQYTAELNESYYQELKRQYDELLQPHAQHIEVLNKLDRLDERIERVTEWINQQSYQDDATKSQYNEILDSVKELRDLAERAWLDEQHDNANLFITEAHNVIDNMDPLAPPPESDIIISGLRVTPPAPRIGATVAVDVIVVNRGEGAGIYEVILYINGNIIESRSVTLTSNSEETVVFTFIPETTGIHTVEVDDLDAIFAVLKGAEEPEEPAALNWWLIGGIIGGCAVITAIFAVFLLRRRFD